MAVCTVIAVLSFISFIVAMQGIMTGHFTLISDSKLDHHNYSSMDVRSLLACGRYCSTETRCLSFNFHQESKDMAGMCDLKNAVRSRDNLTVANGYIYGHDLDASATEDQTVVYMQLPLYLIRSH
jgi:hypothetical protein